MPTPQELVNLDEGYIKFDILWEPGKPLSEKELEEINHWRQRMFDTHLIGVYNNGIGYGNVSQRSKVNPHHFLVTGTQTSLLGNLGPNHFSLVTDFDIHKNKLECTGPVKASSESLSHAMFYQMFKEINGVIHIHNQVMWEYLMGKVPTTKMEIQYGTPEMAYEIQRLFEEENLWEHRILTMAGHDDGIISFGETLADAADVIYNYYEEIFPF